MTLYEIFVQIVTSYLTVGFVSVFAILGIFGVCMLVSSVKLLIKLRQEDKHGKTHK